MKDYLRYYLLGLWIVIVGLQSPVTSAQAKERWQETVPQAEDSERRLGISQPINEGEWLAGAQRADALAGQQGGSLISQYQAYLYQMVGRADLVTQMKRRGFLYLPPACPSAAVLQPVLDTILAKLADHKIVFLNESHIYARDRVLLYALLEPLRQAGFTYLAVEDFEHNPDAYAHITYPGQAPAYLSAREPVFADAVRHAIELGYRLIPHEIDFTNFNNVSAEERMQYREDGQAQNLIDLVLSGDPDARIFVYVGFQHAYEETFTTEFIPPLDPMAMRLKALTGIDPLTIDQTGCRGGESFDALGSIAFDTNGATVVSGDPEGLVDLQVRQRPSGISGRPEWLKALGRLPVPVPEGLRNGLEPVVLEARLANEPEDATPLDRLYLAEGEDLPLMLRPGAYVVRAQTKTGWGLPVSLIVD